MKAVYIESLKVSNMSSFSKGSDSFKSMINQSLISWYPSVAFIVILYMWSTYKQFGVPFILMYEKFK